MKSVAVLVQRLAAVASLVAVTFAATAAAATLGFVGSDSDIGGTFFPGAGPGDTGAGPAYVVAPWRSSGVVKPLDVDGDNVYGTDGYAMFATQFQYPNAYAGGGASVAFDSATYPNRISLPSYVSGSQSLVANKVGGWGYALVDPPSVTGAPDFNWGQTQTPPSTNQREYVKIGILDGNDTMGNNPRTAPLGAGRWAFEVGAGAPSTFRVGVMTDGLDGTNWAATEVVLAQLSGNAVIGSATSGTLTRNRFIDIHSFDITGAQPGDTFAILAKASNDGFGAISAVTFDAIPEPATAGLLACAAMGLAGVRRRALAG